MITKFKDLTTDNLFDFCDVLGAIGAVDAVKALDLQSIVSASKDKGDNKAIGIMVGAKLAAVVIGNLGSARKPIYQFFANTLEWENGTPVTPEELAKFKPGITLKLMRDFFQREDLTDFFSEVAEFLGMEDGNSETSSTEDMAAVLKAL